jgi:hypothetical protein
MDTKLSFAFTQEEMKMIAKIKRTLALTQGKVTNITAVRYALREAVK